MLLFGNFRTQNHPPLVDSNPSKIMKICMDRRLWSTPNHLVLYGRVQTYRSYWSTIATRIFSMTYKSSAHECPHRNWNGDNSSSGSYSYMFRFWGTTSPSQRNLRDLQLDIYHILCCRCCFFVGIIYLHNTTAVGHFHGYHSFTPPSTVHRMTFTHRTLSRVAFQKN